MNSLRRTLHRSSGRARRLLADRLERRLGSPPPAANVEPEHRIMFVCRGNICRSALAEGIVRARLGSAGLLGRVLVESAGTHAGDGGMPPDLRARRVARRNGISIGGMRTRGFVRDDFARFDSIVVFDRENLDEVLAFARDDRDRDKVRLLETGAEVDDPAHGEYADFERLFERLDRAAEALVTDLGARLEPS